MPTVTVYDLTKCESIERLTLGRFGRAVRTGVSSRCIPNARRLRTISECTFNTAHTRLYKTRRRISRAPATSPSGFLPLFFFLLATIGWTFVSSVSPDRTPRVTRPFCTAGDFYDAAIRIPRGWNFRRLVRNQIRVAGPHRKSIRHFSFIFVHGG